MGVMGLLGFLINNPHLSETIELKNTCLVIDANNLLKFLYKKMCRSRNSEHYKSDLYGGDMVSYGETVRNFFYYLGRSNIRPILVFDGSGIGKQATKDQVALKEETSHRRKLDTFKIAQNASEDSSNEGIIMPEIIKHVFKNIASEFGIQRIQAPYEADTHIARVANDIGCPVLTNDSDFIIYELRVGVIILDLFYYEISQHSRYGESCITTRLYSQMRLIECLPGLRAENMALLSALLGNDYIEAGTFEGILDDIGRQVCQYNTSFRCDTLNHERIANTLIWLGNKRRDVAIKKITGYFPPESRKRVEKNMKFLLRSYNIEETNNFSAEVEEHYPSGWADHKTDPERMPAQYLRRLMETSSLSSIILDIVFKNTHYTHSLIDDLSLPTSNRVNYRPLSVLITLLRPRSYSNMSADERQEQVEKDTLLIYDRVNDEYNKVIIRPIRKLSEFGSLEHLDCYTSITLEPALKKSLLMTTFRFNTDRVNSMTGTLTRVFTGSMIQESSICFLLVKYIAKEKRTGPISQFVDALMITLFFYAAKNGQLSRHLLKDRAKYQELLRLLRPLSITMNGESYQPSHSLFRRINHYISQLQSTFISYCALNSFLDHVFQVPKYENYFNGTLIFRLTKLFILGELRLDKICHGIRPLLDACGLIRDMLHCD